MRERPLTEEANARGGEQQKQDVPSYSLERPVSALKDDVLLELQVWSALPLGHRSAAAGFHHALECAEVIADGMIRRVQQDRAATRASRAVGIELDHDADAGAASTGRREVHGAGIRDGCAGGALPGDEL